MQTERVATFCIKAKAVIYSTILTTQSPAIASDLLGFFFRFFRMKLFSISSLRLLIIHKNQSFLLYNVLFDLELLRLIQDPL